MHRLLLIVLIVAAPPILCAAPKEPAITPEQRDHWSFCPLKRPAVPAVKHANWPRNAIDRFILRRIEAAGLRPAPEADRRTLIRRVTFDLTGLPPTPAEVDEFVSDSSPDAYEKRVDRLLSSPAYGEHQAQHWLDLARFAETDGFEHDKVRRNAWRYRDWVIAALNRDLPYDEFVRLQLAADQMRPDDRSAQAALGFLLNGADMPDINSQAERRHAFLNEMTGTVGAVFLGLQFHCAQCHDHKYDPISQADFYRLRAIFDPYFKFARYKPASFLGPMGTQTVSHLMIRGDFRRQGPVVKPAFPRIISTTTGVKQKQTRRALAEWLTRSDNRLATRVIANRLWQWHFGRGLSAAPSDFGVMGDEPTHPQLLDWLATEFAGVGRIANPSASGKPGVKKRDGLAIRPTAWSLKAMHRLIVTSATYRQASRRGQESGVRNQKAPLTTTHHSPLTPHQAWNLALKRDPDNRLWTRMPRRRLAGEAIRDAMLAVSGELSQRRGGPGVRPPLPKELLVTLLKNQWPVSKDERDHRRRSVYLFARRNLRYPIFEAFDKPDTNATCPRRNRSTTAPQALLLLNSRFSLDCAKRLAAEVRRTADDKTKAQVAAAYRKTLGRPPTTTEAALGLRFLNRSDRATALTDLCLVLFNLNEFVYVD